VRARGFTRTPITESSAALCTEPGFMLALEAFHRIGVGSRYRRRGPRRATLEGCDAPS
jgi:hypothetical protein